MENENAEVKVGVASLNDAVKKAVKIVREGMILRGVLFLLFGLFMLSRPAAVMLAVTIIIGLFIAADGFASLFAALRYNGAAKGAAVAGSILFILFGLFTCCSPLIMNAVWVVMLGIWQLISGIQCLCMGKNLPGTTVFSGILSILSGLVLISSPLFGLLAIAWLIGLMLFISGLCAIIAGVRLKKIEKVC